LGGRGSQVDGAFTWSHIQTRVGPDAGVNQLSTFVVALTTKAGG